MWSDTAERLLGTIALLEAARAGAGMEAKIKRRGKGATAPPERHRFAGFLGPMGLD